MELKWKHPFTCPISGPTSSGKTVFTVKFLNNVAEMVDSYIQEIIYCAPEHSYPDLTECRTPIRFLDFLPTAELFQDKKPRLIVIDDMMSQASDGSVADLFTKHSHHLNVSVIFICQNIFYKGKGQRDISLNSHYIACFKSVRDRQQFSTLARQLAPHNVPYMKEIFEDATAEPYGYLVMDLTQTTPDHLRYRTKIFPTDSPSNVIYVPKNFYIKET